MDRSRLHPGFLAILAGLLGFTPSAVAQVSTIREADPRSPVSLIYSISNHGSTRPDHPGKPEARGGLARRATYVLSLRSSGVETVVVSGGDFLFSYRDLHTERPHYKVRAYEQAKLVIDHYNEIGYDAAAVGDLDLGLGIDVLRRLETRMAFPLLCANLVDEISGKLLFPASTIVEREGIEVGVIGVLDPDLPELDLAELCPAGRLTPVVDAVRAEVRKLCNRVDAIVVLAHVDRPELNEISEILCVDFVVAPTWRAGRSMRVTAPRREIETRGDTTILRLESGGVAMGQIDLFPETRGEPWRPFDPQEGNRYRAEVHSLGPHWSANPTIHDEVEAFRDATYWCNPSKGLGFLEKEAIGANQCGACHEKQHRWWSSTGHAHTFDRVVHSATVYRRDCVQCHTTGFGETFVDPVEIDADTRGVQCQACHQGNALHAEDPSKYRHGKVSRHTCFPCHDPARTGTPFDALDELPRIGCPDGK